MWLARLVADLLLRRQLAEQAMRERYTARVINLMQAAAQRQIRATDRLRASASRSSARLAHR